MSRRIVVTQWVEAVSVGDTVQVWKAEHQGVVSEVVKNSDNSIRSVRTETPIGNGLNFDTTIGAYYFEVTKKAPRIPQHWPPQIGDVWEDETGRVYHVVLKDTMYHAGVDGTGCFYHKPARHLEDHPNSKLVYRKGNAPNV